MAVIHVDDYVTVKAPHAVVEVQFGGAPFIRHDADRALRQTQAVKNQHRILAVVLRRVCVEGDRQLQIDVGGRSMGGQRQGREYDYQDASHGLIHRTNFPLTLDLSCSRFSFSDANMPVALRLREPIRMCTRSSVSAT